MRPYIPSLPRLLSKAERVLFVLFWGALLFGFEPPAVALMSLAAAAVHELGHLGAMRLLGQAPPRLRSRLRGCTLELCHPLSYRAQILVAAAGPLANLLCALACLMLARCTDARFLTPALVSLLSALSNLLPVRGYDGEHILRCTLSLLAGPQTADILTRTVSFALSATALLLSLFLMLHFDVGYWAFFVFLLLLVSSMREGLAAGNGEAPPMKSEKK